MSNEKEYKELLSKHQQLKQQYQELLNENTLPAYLDSENILFSIVELIYNTENQAIDIYFKKVNTHFQKLIKLPIEEIIHHKGTDVFFIIEDYWIETFAKVLETGKPQTFQNYSEELQKHFELYAWKVNDREIAIIFNDISEEKEKATKLKESKADEVPLKISKDKLISVIAHDLRSPFNVILGYSKLLIENARTQDDPEETIKYSTILNTKAKEALVMLDNILNWGNTQSEYVNFKIEKVKINSLIREMIQILHPSASIKKISLLFESKDSITVLADRNMLKSIFVNLISNSIKFTNSNGEIKINTAISSNYCEISISDNGVGIDPEKQSDLFSMNTNVTSRGTDDEPGTGLGLLICKKFVQMNHGEIKAESSLGKGSRFTFTLPLNL